MGFMVDNHNLFPMIMLYCDLSTDCCCIMQCYQRIAEKGKHFLVLILASILSKDITNGLNIYEKAINPIADQLIVIQSKDRCIDYFRFLINTVIWNVLIRISLCFWINIFRALTMQFDRRFFYTPQEVHQTYTCTNPRF